MASSSTTKLPDGQLPLVPCRNYLKIDSQENSTFMKCSRCKVAHYCSRECQRKDWWSSHKQSCREPHAEEKTHTEVLQAHISKHYYAIMTEVKRVSLESNMEKRDLVVEIDFFGGGNSLALKNQFLVKPVISVYLRDDRSGMPDWFGTSEYL